MARRSRKTAQRIHIVDRVASALVHTEIFERIDYRKRSEDYIKAFMYGILVDEIEQLHGELAPSIGKARCRRKAQHSVVWEGDVQRTIHNQTFLGVQHRPDFEVLLPGTTVAVEVKRIENGSSLREGLGQAIVYSVKYDFVVFLAIDLTNGGAIKKAVENTDESQFLDRLWDRYNTRFVVV